MQGPAPLITASWSPRQTLWRRTALRSYAHRIIIMGKGTIRMPGGRMPSCPRCVAHLYRPGEVHAGPPSGTFTSFYCARTSHSQALHCSSIWSLECDFSQFTGSPVVSPDLPSFFHCPIPSRTSFCYALYSCVDISLRLHETLALCTWSEVLWDQYDY